MTFQDFWRERMSHNFTNFHVFTFPILVLYRGTLSGLIDYDAGLCLLIFA